jgi:hypothetical protein
MQNLDLIDWRLVGLSALWIVGLAVVLSVLGFADYHAHAERRRFLATLGRPAYRLATNIGLLLFCLGLFGLSASWWERVIWAILALAFLAYAIAAARDVRKRGEG